MSIWMKRLSWALALSLGLNLFLLGYGSARMLQLGGPGHAGARERMSEFLGPPTAALREQHRALRTARKRVGDALVAEPFDVEELRGALAALRETTSRGQEQLHERLLERVEQLPPEERRELSRRRFQRELGGEREPHGERELRD